MQWEVVRFTTGPQKVVRQAPCTLTGNRRMNRKTKNMFTKKMEAEG